MTILIRKARIQDPSSPFHQSVKDIFIENGLISRIGDHITETADRIIENDGLTVSPGWVDVFSDFCDPGYEHKESLETGAQAAAAGGFTHVFLVPNTMPVIHSKSHVEYIIEKSRNLPASLHPIGAITRNTEGKELAEMYDMKSWLPGRSARGIVVIDKEGKITYKKAEAISLFRPKDDDVLAAIRAAEG